MKSVNYTDVQVEEMTAVYKACENEQERKEAVQQLGDKFGKRVQSVVAKLVSLKVYISANKAKAKTVVRKEDRVKAISVLLGIEGDELQSLEKATVQALDILQSEIEHSNALIDN